MTLGDRQPTLLLDRFDAQRAVAAGAGQHDSDCVFARGFGQGREKNIDGITFVLIDCCGEQIQLLLRDGQHRVGRQHVDMVRLHALTVAGVDDGHGRVTRKDLRQERLTMRSDVRDDDERRPDVGRHGAKQVLQRRDAACGGADAHDEQA